ncbi:MULTISPECIES: antibiotic biosynthesis monooxygenase [Streptomyces]|jgi:antibiotic biosynthesis monooxygenase (ABM) superfamily enzyme|uniref:antibiotic biosynthesis monooxygenase n=1 Tax=Streptomyces TaxID=1883 RepID=UPI000F73D541|nr:antibiotic biosynthesis monooxygenase [Streptomyces sp. WAC05292]RSS87172.1 antibiotic biosynthesis monooxygenase [Streptomyces sp. WAC05292]
MALTDTSERTVPADNGEVSLLIARQVEPGYEEAFETWARAILETAAAFPGHLGYGLFRPSRDGAPWFLVHRFRDQEAFRRWQDSPERAAFFANCEGHRHTETARRELHGMETWFAEPGTTRPAPPRWKMAVSSGLAIFPISLAGNALIGPYLVDLHLVLRTAAFAAVFSTLMTYVAMPAVSRLLRPWLTRA